MQNNWYGICSFYVHCLWHKNVFTWCADLAGFFREGRSETYLSSQGALRHISSNQVMSIRTPLPRPTLDPPMHVIRPMIIVHILLLGNVDSVIVAFGRIYKLFSYQNLKISIVYGFAYLSFWLNYKPFVNYCLF